MSLGPILPGRIPNSLILSRSLQNLETRSRLFLQIQDQIATGQQFQTLGEDPAAALKTVLLQNSQERKAQLATNVEVSRSLLSASEQGMGQIGDVYNQLASHALAGLGDATSETEKQQLATEINTMIQDVINIGNTKFRGRFLFGGTNNTTIPFEDAYPNDAIRFNGKLNQIDSYSTLDGLVANNVNVALALQPTANVEGSDVNPAVTAATKIKDLFSGTSLDMGSIEITVDTGGGPQTEVIDLKSADTVQDLVTRMEAPFAGDLTVSITSTGITLTPAAGTVAVDDLPNQRVAADFGLKSAAAASISSSDLDPRISKSTLLSDLNGGAGIGPTAGNGIVVTNGILSDVIDLDGLNTVEDFFNALTEAKLDVEGGFTADGKGLQITSKLSGVGVTVAENGGTNGAGLGLLTFSASTLLSELDSGKGVPVESPNKLTIVRRDGTEEKFSLEGASTVQDVLDAINAIDPGVLVASLKTTGNGIVLSDSSGTGPLVVTESAISKALGIDGTEDGNADLVGEDVGADSTTEPLANLNSGAGVPVGAATLDVTRRDGTVVNINLAAATTVSDVLSLVNAVDPGNLVMTHNSTAGSFSLNDNSGTGPLIVADNAVSSGLGINGTEDGVIDFEGTDPNPQRSNGLLDVMIRMRNALEKGDNQELEVVANLLTEKHSEFNFVRGEVGGRLKSLDRYEQTLVDEDILIQESISEVFDADLATAITNFSNLQVTIQAAQQVAAQTLQLNLFNFI